jgi:hypothetical protein
MGQTVSSILFPVKQNIVFNLSCQATWPCWAHNEAIRQCYQVESTLKSATIGSLDSVNIVNAQGVKQISYSSKLFIGRYTKSANYAEN